MLNKRFMGAFGAGEALPAPIFHGARGEVRRKRVKSAVEMCEESEVSELRVGRGLIVMEGLPEKRSSTSVGRAETVRFAARVS
jgi:hypothetical protein